MKKFMFIAALACFALTANAQTKEELKAQEKAQKEAKKEAEKQAKKAQSDYEMSIPNPQYNRKETDFKRLKTAQDEIETAIANPLNAGNINAWRTAADIEGQYYTKYVNESKKDTAANSVYKDSIYNSAQKYVTYCIKYDSLLASDTKIKDEEKKKLHSTYQIQAWNGAIVLLSTCQNNAYSDNQEDLKKTISSANQFLYATEQSHLFSDLTTVKDLPNYKTLAKVFRAQAYYNLKDVDDAEVENAYKAVYDTSYKAWAYQSITNYYRQKGDTVKWKECVIRTIDETKNDTTANSFRPQFIAQYIQTCFMNNDYAGLEKYGQMIIDEYPTNENAAVAYKMRGEVQRRDGKYDAAEKIFMDGYNQFPDDSEFLKFAATCALQKAQNTGWKSCQHALDLWKQYEAKDPSASDVWGYNLYILYNNTKNTAMAAKYKKYYK